MDEIQFYSVLVHYLPFFTRNSIQLQVSQKLLIISKDKAGHEDIWGVQE
jgi:hypothetical protein